MAYFGNTPADSFTAITKDTFSGNGSTTAFTLTNPATTNGVQVFVENVRQEPTDAYTVSGTTLTFTAAPVTGTDNIYVVNSGTPVSTITHPAGTAIQATSGTFSGNVSTSGDLKVDVSSGGTYTITGTNTATDRTLTLPDETGTVLTSASAGSVLQIQSGSYSTRVDAKTTSYVDTGLSASITPSSTTSKILIVTWQQGRVLGAMNASATDYAGIRIRKTVGGTESTVGGESEVNVSLGSSFTAWNPNVCYLDSPATTSEVSYKTQITGHDASNYTTVQFNDNPSYMYLLEIAG